MKDIKFKDKFIGFVDVLGWKEMVKASEVGTGMPLPELLELLKNMDAPDIRKDFEKYGPTICPESTFSLNDLDFIVTQISDCVIVSSEISSAGVINLVNQCWMVVTKLLTKGIMCRGYITRGLIYHTGAPQFIGSGYQDACSKEKEVTAFKREADERGTPFVEVDQKVSNYVRDHGDSCVKEMFSRYVKGDGEVIALFPFKRLSHSFGGPNFSPKEEKHYNNNIRIAIQNCKQRVMELVDQSNLNAVRKAEHYVAALDAQLEVCDKTDEMIDRMNSPGCDWQMR